MFSVSFLKKSRVQGADVQAPTPFRRGRKVFYDHEVVVAWISKIKAEQVENLVVVRPLKFQQASTSPPANKAAAKRGRPTKAEQIARRAAAA